MITLTLRPKKLKGEVSFDFIKDRLLPLTTKWVHPFPSETKLDELFLLPVNPKFKEVVKKNKPNALPHHQLSLENPSDPLLVFLHVDLPSTAEVVVKILRSAIIFVFLPQIP